MLAYPEVANQYLVQPHQFHLTPQNPDSHKGDNGRVLIIAGSPLFHGAAEFTALGVVELLIHLTSITNDAVYFCSLPIIVEALKKLTPSFIGIYRSELDAYVDRCDVILAGPGLMREPQNDRPETD